jgi:hypothetical protein
MVLRSSIRLVPFPDHPDMAPSRSRIQELSDQELDAYIRARLALVGVDLSVLPEDDPDAPADQRRILISARRFLRTTPSAIAGFEMDPQEVPPILYPAALARRLPGPEGGEGP